VTTFRIARSELRHGRLASGEFSPAHLVVLADDAGHQAVPIWLPGGLGTITLQNVLERPADQVITDAAPQDLTTRLLGAAGAQVTGVDIDVTEAGAAELSPEVTVARIELAGPAGTRQVTADLGLSLALAAAVGAPVRLAGTLLDRLAVPVPGDDLLTPFLDRVPPGAVALAGRPHRWPLNRLRGPRPRYEPRNLDFAGGLDRWELDSWSGADGEPDYVAAAEGLSAVLSSAVPRPAGSAVLVQAIYADDYRGATVTFSGEIRADPLAGQAGLRLEILRHWFPRQRGREDHGLTVAWRHRAWTGYEISARIPADADLIRFGIALTGPGRVALRKPNLHVAGLIPGTP
jgi:hypothetical protein